MVRKLIVLYTKKLEYPLLALGLIRGDKICVGGGMRKASKIYPRILNLEFIDILNLKKNITKCKSLL